jgi:ABC-type antimicrobial peptide transport system permease subunit
VLGVPNAFIQRGGFAWSAIEQRAAQNVLGNGPQAERDVSNSTADNPWTLLHADLGYDGAGRPIVPTVLDASTAKYSMHLKGVGSQLQILDGADQPVTLQVVGLLKNSILQGNLLVSEENFLELFPDTGGYRYFLIERAAQPDGLHAPAAEYASSARRESTQEVATRLETILADDGFDVVDARQQLEQFLAVQNTYLSTFQSLGALGLLLGTIGLAVVQLRSVVERRGELALMRATGFRSRRLMRMVLWENGVLLLGGLAVGCIAAGVALIPHWLPRDASVPWPTLGVLLATIAAVGLLAGWLATRSVLSAPILPALRGD